MAKSPGVKDISNHPAIRSTARRQERRATRRRRRRFITVLAARSLLLAGIVATAAVLITLYRGAGPEKASSSPQMVAEQAPDFRLATSEGKTVGLAELKGKNVLLFFNEGYGCDPCWQQTLQLQQDLQEFTEMGVEVYAVMVDPPELINRERARYGLQEIPVLVDRTTSVSKSYRALGGMHANKPDHKFVLIGRDGTILWAEDYPAMRVDPQLVLDRVRALAGGS